MMGKMHIVVENSKICRLYFTTSVGIILDGAYAFTFKGSSYIAYKFGNCTVIPIPDEIIHSFEGLDYEHEKIYSFIREVYPELLL